QIESAPCQLSPATKCEGQSLNCLRCSWIQRRLTISATGTDAMAGLQPHVPKIYRYLGTGLGASMWFWLMYRAKKDGPVLIGRKHPWDH
ncbi:hypothetical protein B0T14DRAFT_113468, partial [Immersiella caudata]